MGWDFFTDMPLGGSTLIEIPDHRPAVGIRSWPTVAINCSGLCSLYMYGCAFGK